MRFWEKLTQPHPDINEPEDRRRARIISTILAIVIPLEIVIVLARLVTTNAPFHTLGIGFLSLVLICLAYAISRTPRFQVAALLTVGMAMLTSILEAATDPSTTLAINYLSLASLAGMIFLRPRYAVFMASVNISAVLILIAVLPEWTPQLVINDLVYLVSLSIIILMVLLVRRQDIAHAEQQTVVLRELVEQEIRYREILESMTDVFYTIGPNGVFRYVNLAAETLTGYSREHLLKMAFIDLVAPNWKDQVGAFYVRQYKERQRETMLQFVIQTATGEQKWVEQSVKLVANDTPHFEGVVRDITRRKQAELTLAKRNQELELLNLVSLQVASSLNLVDVLREIARLSCLAVDATSVYVNDVDLTKATLTVMAEYYGSEATKAERFSTLNRTYSLSHDMLTWLHHPTLSHIVHDDEKSVLFIPLMLGGSVRGTLEIWDTRQQREFTSENIQLIQSIAFQAAVFIANARLHESVKATAAELEAVNRELDSYAHTIAHDLKGPLSNIGMFAQLMRMQYKEVLPADVFGMVDRIDNATLKMSEMISQLLRLATLRGAIEEVRPVDMNQAARAAVERFEGEIEKHQVVVEIAPELPCALGHKLWAEEVFANLIGNAIKYSAGCPERRITIRGHENGACVRYEVEDTGIGIPPDAQADLFQMFTRLKTLKAEGSGLGLSIVHRMVTRLNGQVGVESKAGQGSTFWFTLPKEQPYELNSIDR